MSAFFQTHAGLFQHFFQYFKSTWLGVWNGDAGQIVPQYSVQLWNCFESLVQNNSPKMNLTSKSYHAEFMSHMTFQKITLCKFMDSLLKTQAKTEAKLALFNANKPDNFAPAYKKLLQHEQNLKKIIQAYPQTTDVLSYLNGIACFLVKNRLLLLFCIYCFLVHVSKPK